MEPFEFSWKAPEYLQREKNTSWYWGTIIVAVLVLGLAVWQRNFLFAVFTVTAEILILVWSSREPELIPFRLTDKGLMIRERNFYPLSDIESFSVEEHEGLAWPAIALRFHRKFRPLLHIRVLHTEVDTVVDHLRERLPQTPWDETFIDTLEKFIGF